MNSPPEPERNVSGFIRYNDKNFKYLYCSMLQNMELIHQDIMQIEQNLKNITTKSGPIEGQLSVLLQTLPKPELKMETE